MSKIQVFIKIQAVEYLKKQINHDDIQFKGYAVTYINKCESL